VVTLKKKIKNLKDKNKMVITINKAFGKENDQLNAEIKHFQSFRLPRSLKLIQSSLQLSSDDDLADVENESTIRPVKCRKDKGQKLARTDDREDNQEEARVCNIH